MTAELLQQLPSCFLQPGGRAAPPPPPTTPQPQVLLFTPPLFLLCPARPFVRRSEGASVCLALEKRRVDSEREQTKQNKQTQKPKPSCGVCTVSMSQQNFLEATVVHRTMHTRLLSGAFHFTVNGGRCGEVVSL